MGISSDQNRVNYSGNGSSAVFNYPYEFHADKDVAVLVYNSSRSTITAAKALTTDYNISGTKDLQGRYLNGANVVFNSAPATGDEITLFGSTAVNSVYALGFNEHISRPDLVKALDHLVLINQRLNNQITRSVRLPDSYPYSFDTTLPERLTAGAPLVVNSGGIGIQIGIVQNSSGFAGVFPMANGGLGAALVATAGQILYALNPTTMALSGPGGQDQVLIQQSSLVPIFSGINLFSGSSVVGILPAARGGTAHSSFVAASLVYASSANIMSFIANGGADQPLVGNVGGAPSYQPLNLASNSSVTNILSTSRGGTGNSGYIQYGVAYLETASKFGVVPSASNGRVLTCHGSSAPSFDAIPASSPIVPVRAVSNYIATTSDEAILCDGSSAAFSVQVPSAAAASGQRFFIKKVDSSVNKITIIGSGGQTLDGTSLVLANQNDSYVLEPDSTQYYVLAKNVDKNTKNGNDTGIYSNATTSYTDLASTNPINISGKRNVLIKLMASGSGIAEINLSRTTGSIDARFNFFRDAVSLGEINMSMSSGFKMVPGVIEFLDLAPQQGNYTYKVQSKVLNGTNTEVISVSFCKLVAYET